MSFPQTANLTNQETTEQIGSVLMGVPWSEGEMADIATLRAGYRVRIGGTTYPTHWHARGAPYASDNSLRMTYAVFRPTLAAGAASPTGPQYTPTVVAADNTGTAAASFAAWASALDITIEYDDWLVSQAISTNAGALARAGTNISTDAIEAAIGNNGYRIRDEGGKRTILYHAWLGLGARHEPYRTGGNNANNPLVERQGLLHVVIAIEIRDQDTYATVSVGLFNDAAYPYPSAPPDGGHRRPGQPDRPTHLNPAETNPITLQAEQLESTLQRHVENMTITISHASTPLFQAPWYVSDHATGASPMGTITTVAGVTAIPIRGLGDRQGWGMRFAVSAVDQNDAVAKARRPNTFLATPTYATWLATEWSREWSGGIVDGDEITRRGWWLFSLPDDIPQSTFDTFWTRNNSATALSFMNRTIPTPWSTPPDDVAIDRSVNGGTLDPNRGGKHYGVGLLNFGEAMLGGCPEFIYKLSGWAMRHAMCYPTHLEHAALLSMDPIRDTTGRDRYHCYIEGSKIGQGGDSLTYLSFGRHRAGVDGGGANLGSNFNGTICPTTNPDTDPVVEFGSPHNYASTPQWGHFKNTHFAGMPIFYDALIRDDAMSDYLLEGWALLVEPSQPGRTWFARSPTSVASRGEMRPMMRLAHGYLRSRNAVVRQRLYDHAAWRYARWTAAEGASQVRWSPPGNALDNPNTYPTSACGVRPYAPGSGHLYQWWLVGQCTEEATFWAMELTDETQASSIASSICAMTGACVDFGVWIDPTRITAAHPAGERAFDACWTTHAATSTDPLVRQHGIIFPKHSQTNVTASTPTSVRISNLHADVGVRNDAQTMQQWPAYPLSLVFAANRNRAGHVERVAFVRNAMRAIYPELASGYAYADDPQQHLGFLTGDSYQPGTTTPPPAPRFTASAVTGFIPLEIDFDASASSYQGAGASIVCRWYAHYAGPTSTVTETINGTAGLTWAYTYSGAGQFTPALDLQQADGQRARFVFTPPIDARTPGILAPIPRFTASSTAVLGGEDVQFTYVELGGRALTYAWEYKLSTAGSWTSFGSGAQNPVWSAPLVAGLYDFRVTATNETGPGTHTESEFITVAPPIPPPVPVFTPSQTSGAVPLVVTLDGNDSTYTGAVGQTTWEWWKQWNPNADPDEEIDGPTGASVEFTYEDPGTYYPALRLTQAGGLSATYIFSGGIVAFTIPVGDVPAPGFSTSPTSTTVGSPVTFTYSEHGFRALTYSWSYRATEADPETWVEFSTERSPVWVPDAHDVYDIRVIATNEFGTGEKEKLANVTVASVPSAPVATFTADPTSGEQPLTVDFDASASTLEGNPAVATWDWYADEAQETYTQRITGSTGETWQHEYTEPGVFRPKLVLTQEDSQFSEFNFFQGILVIADPVTSPPSGTVSVDSETADPGQAVLLEWIDGALAVPALSWVWEYRAVGDPDWIIFAESGNPAVWVAPDTAGEYEFQVLATNGGGTTTYDEIDTVTVTSGSAPVASFTLEQYIFHRDDEGYPTPLVVVASNDSTDAEGYRWELFGVESGAEIPTSIHAPGVGTWTIRLTVTNAYGEDSTVRRVTVVSGSESIGVRGHEAASGVFIVPSVEVIP